MSKINDNSYVNKIKQEIVSGTFSTKEDLINFLLKNKESVLNDTYFNQELNNSFIKLNEETLKAMEKELLEFYDKTKNNDIASLNLEGVSGFKTNDDQDYIKYVNEDGEILVFDDSLEDDSFVKQFNDRLNDSSLNGNAEQNKQEIINDMKYDKINVNLYSSQDTNMRDLTQEEKQQFASVLNMPDANKISFLIDPKRNIYINKDTGEVYFVSKNKYGDLEVRKANEVTSETTKQETPIIDDKGQEQQVTVESSAEPNFENMEFSDLEYIYENKLGDFDEKQRQRLTEIVKKRREEMYQQSLTSTKKDEKVFVKKLDSALHKPYNGFVSFVFLCSNLLFFGLGFLLLIISKFNID